MSPVVLLIVHHELATEAQEGTEKKTVTFRPGDPWRGGERGLTWPGGKAPC